MTGLFLLRIGNICLEVIQKLKHNNTRKDKKLKNFPNDSIETSHTEIKGLLAFNFKYLDTTQGQKFSDLSAEQVEKVVEKLKWFSNENRLHWEAERIGNKDGKVLSVYDSFPQKTEFFHPKNVPADVRWCRLRLEGDMRLVGFVVDKNDTEKFQLNADIFYVVFLDLYHKFYITDK